MEPLDRVYQHTLNGYQTYRRIRSHLWRVKDFLLQHTYLEQDPMAKHLLSQLVNAALAVDPVETLKCKNAFFSWYYTQTLEKADDHPI